MLNSEGGALDYNPYVYARNNPYKFIDRNGEEPVTLTVLAIGFLVGGTVNVAFNWENIQNWVDGLKFFGIGGVAGSVGAAFAAIAPAGFFSGALYGTVGGGLSGSILGGCNALVLGQNFLGGLFSGAWQGAASGALFGGIMGGAKANAKGLKYWSGGDKKIPTVSTPSAANASVTPQNASPEFTPHEVLNPNAESSSPQTLVHYTTEDGYHQIMKTESLNPSIGIKNARYGEGQYLTNLEPKDYTAGQISRRLYQVPWNTSKVKYFIKIDVNGLNVIQNNPNNFLIPGNNPLNLHGRIVNGGVSIFKISF